MFFLKGIKGFFNKFFRALNNLFFYDKENGEEIKSEEEILLKEAEMALKEWKLALHSINFITDFEAIDYNIYLIQTAERKYIYLLNKAKKENIVYEPLKRAVS